MKYIIDNRVGTKSATLHFDGGCHPNPGPSRCGFVLHVAGSLPIQKSIELGQGTNNTAEYNGLILGMKLALELGVTELHVFGDSQIVIGGVGKMRPYKKGAPHLELLKADAMTLVRKFQLVSLTWIPRDQNSEADSLT